MELALETLCTAAPLALYSHRRALLQAKSGLYGDTTCSKRPEPCSGGQTDEQVVQRAGRAV